MIERLTGVNFIWNGGEIEIAVKGAGSATISKRIDSTTAVVVKTTAGEDMHEGLMVGAFSQGSELFFTITGGAKVYTNR